MAFLFEGANAIHEESDEERRYGGIILGSFGLLEKSPISCIYFFILCTSDLHGVHPSYIRWHLTRHPRKKQLLPRLLHLDVYNLVGLLLDA